MKLSINRERFKIYIWIGVAFVCLNLLRELGNPDTFFKKAWNNIWLTIYLVVLNFAVFEYAWPYFQKRWRRLILAPFVLFAIMMLCSFGFYAWRAIGIGLNLYFPMKQYPSIIDGVREHVGYSFGSLFFFAIVGSIYFYQKLKEKTQQLLIEKQKAELNYLKSQTNPHFLFNTLNNIYSLSRDKSDLAPESILRLSKILRFMLYETGGANIAIEQEIKIMGDYIALEKLRYDESLRVNVNYDIEDMKQSIPPLLLMPLVENAFKHGVSESRSLPFVEIHLSVRNRTLDFMVRNSIDAFEANQILKESIGLSNLRRQLELLYTDYSLSAQPLGNEFVATLKINLATRV
jgi:two-component system, LytTR family, sensor kinase